MKDLDRRLAALGRVDIDHDLDALENVVWSKVNADTRRSLAPLPKQLSVGTCALIALLASGAGVAAAKAPPAPSVFAIHAPLAPSTAIGGG